MKKLISVFTLVAMVFSLTLSAQEEPKQEKKTATSEKSCSTAEKKSCGTAKKGGCCASKKATEEKKA